MRAIRLWMLWRAAREVLLFLLDPWITVGLLGLLAYWIDCHARERE